MVTPHMLCYTDFLQDRKMQYYVGWSHIYWMCQNMILVWIIICYFLYHSLALYYRKYIDAICNWVKEMCKKYCGCVYVLLAKIIDFFKRYVCRRRAIPHSDSEKCQDIKAKFWCFWYRGPELPPPPPEVEEPPEPEPVDEGPTFLEKLLLCFMRKKPDPEPEPPEPYVDRLTIFPVEPPI